MRGFWELHFFLSRPWLLNRKTVWFAKEGTGAVDSMPWMMINGLFSYYEVRGTGFPLVLIHNDAFSSAVWDSLLPQVLPGRLVVTYDRRGHGATEIPPPSQPFSFEDCALDLKGLVDSLKLGQVDLFGYSGGALVALDFCRRWPEQVRSLVLAEPPMLGLAKEFPIETNGLKADEINEIVDRQGVQAGIERWFSAVLPADRLGIIFRSRFRGTVLSRPSWIISGILKAGEEYCPSRDSLARIFHPTLLVLGRESRPVFSSVISVLSRLLPNNRVLTIPGADHGTLVLPSVPLLEGLGKFWGQFSPTGCP